MRERKREQNRAMTAETAWRLFIERGYDEVTVADICAAAGIAPRTFHRYFAAKEDVVGEPLRRMTAVVADRIADAPAGMTDVEVLRSALLALGNFAVENRGLLTALRLVAERSQQLRAARSSTIEQENAVVALLAARDPGGEPAGWRRRLLVGCAVAAYRVWYDDYLGGVLADPDTRLHDVLNRVFEVFLEARDGDPR